MKKVIDFHSPIFKILLIFLSWRIFLILIMLYAINFVPLGSSDRFLGGGFLNYSASPQLFSWANFDGEHYLSIAIFGYKNLEQAFFPVYPSFISILANPDISDMFGSLVNSTLVGLLISNISLILALIFLFELIRMDYSKKIAYLVVFIILLFPTSFYFGSVYNESLFLLLSVLSFYSARKGNWFLAGIFGALASATRVFGILLLPALFLESRSQKVSLFKASWIFLIPLGLGGYMLFLNSSVGDPVAFYNLQTQVGQQHQRGIIILPQVYFRYLKMIATTGIQNPIFQTIVLEFLTGILFFLLPIYGFFKKIKISYLFYAMAGFLLPTIQGSFSSSPRYVLILFPAFLAAAIWFNSLPKILKSVVVFLLVIFLIFETTLFLRGHWIA